MKVPTTDASGTANGFLVPIWNALENPELRPEQVYLTTVAPGACKGPHLHRVRRGAFTCIKGNVKIVAKLGGKYAEFFSGESHDYRRIVIPPGVPAAIYCIGDSEAFVLNMPNPAWAKEQPDEWPVTDWTYV